MDTRHHGSKAEGEACIDNYIEENAEWDPFYVDKADSGKVEITFEDETRLTYMNAINFKPDRSIGDVNSARSALTGDSHTSGASSIRSETSFGAAINRTVDLKMALAVTKKDAFDAVILPSMQGTLDLSFSV